MKIKTVYRISTFVPPEHADTLLAGILKVAALAYGNYDQVAWWSAPGVEQFRPRPGSSPTLGEHNIMGKSSSIKLEFAIPHNEELLQRVLVDGIAAHHPWEEPVIYVSESLSTRAQSDEDCGDSASRIKAPLRTDVITDLTGARKTGLNRRKRAS